MPACLAWATLLISYLLAAPSPTVKWLVIAASSPQITPALDTIRTLTASWPKAAVIAGKDCSNLSPDLYLAVVSLQTDRAAAQSEATRLKTQIPDAYIRACTVRPESRLQLGIPLLDASIGKVPGDAVNWTDADRISQVISLPEEGHLWIRRQYVADAEDPNEGRRTAVLFFDHSASETHQLESDCPNFSYSAQAGFIAISCARAVAGDDLFHTIDVFERNSLGKIASVERCRKPQISDKTLSCEEEQVGPDGKLRLTTKQVPLQSKL